MNENFITIKLAEFGLNQKDIDSLSHFISHGGLQKISEEEYVQMMDYFSQYPDHYSEIVPFMTDNNSNYVCVYINGKHKGAICFLLHDAIDLWPKFSSITVFLDTLKLHPQNDDLYEVNGGDFN